MIISTHWLPYVAFECHLIGQMSVKTRGGGGGESSTVSTPTQGRPVALYFHFVLGAGVCGWRGDGDFAPVSKPRPGLPNTDFPFHSTPFQASSLALPMSSHLFLSSSVALFPQVDESQSEPEGESRQLLQVPWHTCGPFTHLTLSLL